MKTLILAAGEGKRLRPLTETYPKPMLLIAGKPTLQHVIENLKLAGLTDIIIVVGFLKEQVMDYFGTGYDFGVKIKYAKKPYKSVSYNLNFLAVLFRIVNRLCAFIWSFSHANINSFRFYLFEHYK